uniref:hypothetical protein n=1 Tax=Pseudomonas aeruginosa TaxID=287 RepID=UPI001ABBFACE
VSVEVRRGDDLHLFDPCVFRLAFDNARQVMRVLEQQRAGDHLTLQLSRRTTAIEGPVRHVHNWAGEYSNRGSRCITALLAIDEVLWTITMDAQIDGNMTGSTNLPLGL